MEICHKLVLMDNFPEFIKSQPQNNRAKENTTTERKKGKPKTTHQWRLYHHQLCNSQNQALHSHHRHDPHFHSNSAYHHAPPQKTSPAPPPPHRSPRPTKTIHLIIASCKSGFATAAEPEKKPRRERAVRGRKSEPVRVPVRACSCRPCR